MYRFKTTLVAVSVATVLVAGMSTSGKAASTDAQALKEATIACRAEAKDQKLSWFARRKYVKNCLARTVKLTPAEAAKIAVKQAVVGCKAQARGQKVSWLGRRKYVNDCVEAALKDYSLDVKQVRREMKINDLRVYTSEEIGCRQNVFC
jgi:hypothetical protein